MSSFANFIGFTLIMVATFLGFYVERYRNNPSGEGGLFIGIGAVNIFLYLGTITISVILYIVGGILFPALSMGITLIISAIIVFFFGGKGLDGKRYFQYTYLAHFTLGAFITSYNLIITALGK